MYSRCMRWSGWLLVVLIGPAVAQVPSTGVPLDAESGEAPAFSSTRRVPDDYLDRHRRPSVVLPSEPAEPGRGATERSGAVIARLSAEMRRLPEGYVIGSRPAYLKPEDEWYVAHLLPRPGMVDAPPLRLLPNQHLALIESVLAETQETPQFVLTGRVTEYLGANYLLIEHVAEVLTPPTAPAEAPPPPVATAPPPTEAEVAPGPEPAAEPSPEEIIRQLMETKPLRAVVLPPEPDDAVAPAAPDGASSEPLPNNEATATQTAAGAVQMLPEGTIMIDQLGRFVPAGEQGWSLAFEDPGRDAGRPPIRVLPSRLLETAVALSTGTAQGGVFMVSGEVTTYKGLNYLLLRKVLVRRDLGNFR